jgi:hypothetical protein
MKRIDILKKMAYQNGREPDANEFWWADDLDCEDENEADEDLLEGNHNQDRWENRNPDGSEFENPETDVDDIKEKKEEEENNPPLQPGSFYPMMYGYVGLEGATSTPLEYYSGGISEEPGAITNNPYNNIYQMAKIEWRLIQKKGMLEGLERAKLLSLASIFSDLVEKYPEYSAKIKMLNDADPTPNKKYLPYAVKQLVSKQALEGEIVDVIKLFHKLSPKLDQKDINQWNFTQLRDKLFALRDSGQDKSKRQEKTDIKTSGGIKLFEDEQCVLMRVDTKAAACFYGAGTKWCITMEGEQDYEDYVSSNVVFYFVLRKDVGKENTLYKIAIAVQRDMNNKILSVDAWDVLDERMFVDTALIDLKAGKQIKQIISDNSREVKPGFLAKLNNKPEELTEKDYEDHLKLGENITYILENNNTPPKILEKIFNENKNNIDIDKKYKIIGLLSSNDNTPLNVLDQIAKDSTPGFDIHIKYSLWKRLLEHKNISSSTIKYILDNTTDKYIMRGIAENKNSTGDILRKLYQKSIGITGTSSTYIDHSLIHYIMENENTDKSLADDLYTQIIDDAAKIVLARQTQNKFIQEKLFNEKDKYTLTYLTALAGNKHIHKEVAQKLAKLDDNNIRFELAINISMYPEILDQLYETADEHTLVAIARNPNTSIDTQKKLTTIPKKDIRSELATYTEYPEVLEILSKDDNKYTRSSVINNKHTEKHILENALNDPEKTIRELAAITIKLRNK